MKLLAKKEQIENGFIAASKKYINSSYQEHGHEFFEIEYVISGSGIYIIDGVEYSICENMMFFMTPSNFHSIKECDAEIINVMFSCNLCDLNAIFGLYSSDISPAIQLSKENGTLFEKLLSEIAQSNDTDYSVQFLNCVIYKYLSLIQKKKKIINSHIRSVIMYLLENFRRPLHLADAAEFVALTPEYLSALFLQETGVNFKTYLDNLRYDYVTKLLAFTRMPIAVVCSEAGFCDYANFNRRFKERYSLSPGEYRKLHMKNKK